MNSLPREEILAVEMKTATICSSDPGAGAHSSLEGGGGGRGGDHSPISITLEYVRPGVELWIPTGAK